MFNASTPDDPDTLTGRLPSLVLRTASRFDAGSVLTIRTLRPESPSRVALAQAREVFPTPPFPVKNRWRGALRKKGGQSKVLGAAAIFLIHIKTQQS
jgi:hypothetical protein